MPPVTSRAMSFAILQEQLIRLRGRQVIPARVALGMVLRECGAKNATQARRRGYLWAFVDHLRQQRRLTPFPQLHIGRCATAPKVINKARRLSIYASAGGSCRGLADTAL
jgi:hypothetical protein